MTNTFATKPGRAAVLNYGSPYPFNDGAFLNPSANLGAFKWHSDLYYLGSNQVLTGTVNLNYKSSGWAQSGNDYVKVLASHYKGYSPIILGYLVIDGARVPINGTMLTSGPGSVSGATAYVSLNVFADSGNVIIRQSSVSNGYLVNKSASYTLFVCNMGVNSGGGLQLPALFNDVYMSPTQFRAGYFDPQSYRYFYRDPGGLITLYKNRSLDVDVGALPASPSYFMLGAVQNINGYSFTGIRSAPRFDTSAWSRNWPGTNASFSPAIERVSATSIDNRGITIKPGYIGLGSGFNTNQNTLLISNYVPATLTIPTFSTSGGGIYRTDSYGLGYCHPNATLMLGIYTLNGQNYSIGGTNFSKLSVLRMGPSQSYTVDSPGLVLPAVGQTFYLSNQGGTIVATVRSFCPRGVTANITGSTLYFKILAATFDY